MGSILKIVMDSDEVEMAIYEYAKVIFKDELARLNLTVDDCVIRCINAHSSPVPDMSISVDMVDNA